MTEAIITGPGFYRQRNGGKAEVVAKRAGQAIGYDGEGNAAIWFEDGLLTGWRTNGDSDHIIAPWQEPRKLEIEIWESEGGELIPIRRALSAYNMLMPGFKQIDTITWTEPTPGATSDDPQDRIEGLQADLDAAVTAAYRHGAIDWVKANYPSHKCLYEPAPAHDGDEKPERAWIHWGGGRSPAPEDALVDVMLRSGAQFNGRSVNSLSWQHSKQYPEDDIIAYRIHRGEG